MGDRAGGLAYWGRGTLSVVQTEGLALDIDYLRARWAQHGAEYLERRFPIDYYVVDRTFVPQVEDAAGAHTYIVADPIQGRVANQRVPMFCFPQRALQYWFRYEQRGIVSDRMAFAFRQRTSCTARERAVIEAAIHGAGLRQLSLPEEYRLDPSLKRAEDRDRP